MYLRLEIDKEKLMTTTVRELKIWLEQFPEDTEVEVLEVEQTYSDDITKIEPLNLKQFGNWDFFDATKNQFVKEDHPCFGRKILTLGEK
jgi:hypothetical protein